MRPPSGYGWAGVFLVRLDSGTACAVLPDPLPQVTHVVATIVVPQLIDVVLLTRGKLIDISEQEGLHDLLEHRIPRRCVQLYRNILRDETPGVLHADGQVMRARFSHETSNEHLVTVRRQRHRRRGVPRDRIGLPSPGDTDEPEERLDRLHLERCFWRDDQRGFPGGENDPCTTVLH